MTYQKEEKFYVGFLQQGDQINAYGFSTLPKKFEFKNESSNDDSPTKIKKEHPRKENDFSTVFDDFIATLESYRLFMPVMLNLAPIARAVSLGELVKFAKNNGTRRDDLSAEGSDVYELDIKFYSQYRFRHEAIISARDASNMMPEVLIIGLISAYDSFLSSLLRAVINRHPEIVLTSQKEIKFKELLEFGSIDAAKSALIDREIEDVIRRSHHEQFDWMQQRLSVKLKDRLKVWPTFVEICERRNLFTHTGGVASNQYIKNCKEHKCNVSDINIGDRLDVSPAYFNNAVEVIYEIGLKLCYVLWRKFGGNEAEEADSRFNERCMQLISAKSYRLAESLLSFSRTVPRLTDNIRRMMTVNLANAIRLQDRNDEAKKLLDTEDWSATNDEFAICVASVSGNIDRVLELMDKLGARFKANQFREWPVFRITRDDARFLEKFETIYGEPFMLDKKEVVPEIEVPIDSETGGGSPEPSSVH